ncbi:reverse transcriptase domain-containing protein [Tanacetum coccineum]
MVHQPAAPLQQAENIKVAIHLEYLEESIILGGGLIDKGKKAMCEVLKANLDVVAWKPTDMIRVPRTLDEHKLGVKEGTPKVRQKKRGQALEKSKVVNEEVQKLVEARIMREVTYHSWISNPVLVKKHDGSWRMCLDFTDLNKACPLLDFAWAEEAKKAMKELEEAYGDTSPPLPRSHKGEDVDNYTWQKLQLPEVIYPPREKLDLAIIHTTRRLRRYFQAHPIAVVTDQPIKQPILAEVLAEKTNLAEEPVKETEEVVTNTWKLFTNNSSNEGGSGAEGIEFTYALRFKFNASNNEADYEALLARLRITESMGVKHIGAFMDSKLGTSRGTIVQVNKRDGGDGDVEEEGNTWFIPFKEYLEHATLLDGKGKARRLKARANQYVVLEWVIYQRSFLGPWLRCVGLEQDEYAYRSLGEGIKAWLGKENKDWIEELPHVLWAHWTIIKSSNRNTPFSLTYGTAARVAAIAKWKHNGYWIKREFNSKVRSTILKHGDLVYQSNEASKKEDT